MSFPTCDYCDYAEVHALSQIIIDKVVEASLVKYPSKASLTPAASIKLIDQIQHALCLDSSVHKMAPYKYSRAHVTSLLDEYIKSSHKILNMFNLMKEDPATRRAHTDTFFSEEQGLRIAMQLIQRFDTDYTFHCREPNCGAVQETSVCPFLHVNCVNSGCPMKFSRHEGPAHDTVCPYKILLCECGMELPRFAWNQHTANECIMRIVPCPYAGLGCNMVMKYKDVEDHNTALLRGHFNYALETVNRLNEEKAELNAKLQVMSIEVQKLRTQQQRNSRNASYDDFN